jgi:hypothetical protein
MDPNRTVKVGDMVYYLDNPVYKGTIINNSS